MDSLNINKTLLDQSPSHLLEEQCVQCLNMTTTKDIGQNEEPEKLLYVVLLICGFAFFTLVVMYWHITSRQRDHSMDPYNRYIIGTWKEDGLILVNHVESSASLTIANESVLGGHPRPKPGPSSM